MVLWMEGNGDIRLRCIVIQEGILFELDERFYGRGILPRERGNWPQVCFVVFNPLDVSARL